MKTINSWVCPARLLGIAFAVAMLASALAPAHLAAHDGHEQSNVIANADGANVRLRSGPSSQDDEITRFPEGSAVEIIGGPHTAADGGAWHQVTIDGRSGYMDSAFLVAVESRHAGIGGSGVTSGIATTNNPVHLRTGPSTVDAVVRTLGAGERVTLTGASQDGWNSVSATGGDGWVFAEFLDFGDSIPGTRYTIESVHLRTGPGTSFDSITTMEAGVELESTGAEAGEFVEVTSPFGEGWVSAQFIGNTAPAAAEAPLAEAPAQPVPDEAEATAEPMARFATANVNLRSESSQSAPVVIVIADGAEVEFSGDTENGYSRVTTAAGAGWISSDYLAETRPESPAQPELSSSLITWPVAGGEWFISQGYNGSSHQNRDQYWQYFYSLDLKRSDGSTAGQPIYAPVNGTVRWIDESTGGMSIDIGSGLAYAFFHARLDPGIREGDVIAQGQFMGTIAPAGEAASGSSAHLHITIWETSDGGNFSRSAIPFTGAVAIEGIDFPATGAGNDHRGYAFNP